MTTLVMTLIVFVAFHMIPALGPVRRALIATVGKAPYIVGYSLASLGLLGWVGIAYAEAPYLELWPQQAWMRWVPLLAMAPACVLLVGALVQPNPFSVGRGGGAYDPARAGVVSLTRHPLLWALVVWALAHVVPNGDAASVVLFGFFAGLGLMGPISLDAKAKRTLGAARWAALAPQGGIDWRGILGWPLIGGLVLYAVLLGAHAHVIGVSPWPLAILAGLP